MARRAILLGLTVSLLASSAAAAPIALRTEVVVAAPVLRLGHLFEGLGDRADAVVARAPAPGERVVLDASRLTAVAADHGIAWRPDGPEARIAITGASRRLEAPAIEAALQAALAGDESTLRLRLDDALPPLHLPPEASAAIAVRGLRLDRRRGRFVALLDLPEGARPDERLRVSGTIEGEAGEARRPRQRPAARPDAGTPATLPRGSVVTMRVEAPGMTLSTHGRTLEDGRPGGAVRVLNLRSHAVLEAIVEDAATVRVPFPAAGTGTAR